MAKKKSKIVAARQDRKIPNFNTPQQRTVSRWHRKVFSQYTIPTGGIGIGMPGPQAACVRREERLYEKFRLDELQLIENNPIAVKKLKNWIAKQSHFARAFKFKVRDIDINDLVDLWIDWEYYGHLKFFEYDNYEEFRGTKRRTILRLLRNITPEYVVLMGSIRHGKKKDIKPILETMRRLGYNIHILSCVGPMMAIVGVISDDAGTTFEYKKVKGRIVVIRQTKHKGDINV